MEIKNAAESVVSIFSNNHTTYRITRTSFSYPAEVTGVIVSATDLPQAEQLSRDIVKDSGGQGKDTIQ